MYYEGKTLKSSYTYSPVGSSSSSGGYSMPVWLSGVLGAVGSLAGNIFNYFSQKKTNESNQKINQQNIDYQTAMTREQWERDDTAHQREVADLEAAGLSPLANTTGSQVTSALSAPNPIAMQAPQIDTNSLINSVLQASALEETKRHNLETEGHAESELYLRGEEIKNKSRELDIQNKQVEGTIRYQADLIQNELKTIAETQEHNDEEEYLRRVEYESEMYWKEIKQQVPGDYNYQDIYDFDIYTVRMNLWNTQFEHFMDKIGATQTAKARSQSDKESTSLGANAVGMAGGNLSGSFDYSHSEYDMENLSEKQKQMLIQFYTEHPKPVYHVKRWELKK